MENFKAERCKNKGNDKVFIKQRFLFCLNLENFVTRLISLHSTLNLTTYLSWLCVLHSVLTVLRRQFYLLIGAEGGSVGTLVDGMNIRDEFLTVLY